MCGEIISRSRWNLELGSLFVSDISDPKMFLQPFSRFFGVI